MYKKIVLIILCFLVAVSCSSPSSPSSGSNGVNGGGSGNGGDSGNTGDGGDSGGIPWTEIAPPLPVLDDEAKTYGIDISQDDSVIKEQIRTKIQQYNKDKGAYKVIFTGTPKAEYTQLNSLARLVIDVAYELYEYKNINIEIDISNIYFNERKIKSSMFKGYTRYGSYTITFKFPENIIRVIEGNAFSLFSKFLKEITIPDSVITIDNYAFQKSDSIEKITFNATSKIEHIGDLAFSYSKIKEIVIPASVKSMGGSVFGSSSSLTTVTYLGTSPNAISHSGDVFPATAKTLILPNVQNLKPEEWQNFLGGNFTDIRKN